MANLPNLLSCLRLSVVPVLLGLAWINQREIFLLVFILSLLTDIADGLLARKLHLASELGAKLDSWADLLTYMALPFCGWWLRPGIVREEQWWLAIGIGSYIAAILIGALKFQRLTSYHTWGAKASAVLVGAAVLVFFANGPGWFFRVVMPLVFLANLEEIAITLILPRLTVNVPSLWHALNIRRRWQKGESANGSISPVRNDLRSVQRRVSRHSTLDT